MSLLDPEIEKAVAEAIRRNPRQWDEAWEDETGVTSNPADDQATRLRELLRSTISGTEDLSSRELRVEEGSDAHAPIWRSVPPKAVPPKTEIETRTRPTMIVVASGKGGVGKTNIAVNLAVALAGRGSRVTLLDADLGTANADVLCGVTPSARLEHVVSALPVHDGARRNIRDIAVDVPGGFRLIAGSSGVGRLADLTGGQQRQLLESLGQLDDDTDVLIVDTGAGVSRAVTSFVAAADLAVVVTTPEPTAITDAYALIKCAMVQDDEAQAGRLCHGSLNESALRLMLVVNQVSGSGGGEDEARRVHARLAAVCDRFLGVGLPMLGWVAHDLRLPEAVRARQPVLVRSPKTPAARHIQALAGSLAQQVGLDGVRSGLSDAGAGMGMGIAGALARVLRFSGR